MNNTLQGEYIWASQKRESKTDCRRTQQENIRPTLIGLPCFQLSPTGSIFNNMWKKHNINALLRKAGFTFLILEVWHL